MSIISLPKWVLIHLYTNKTYETLTPEEIDDLRARLKPFSSETPEVSIVIPAWNEQNNLFRTLSSLSATKSSRQIEIIVINNNSTDSTQLLLDQLNIANYLQSEQGTPFARQMGLYKAKGRFHLCADSDTFYPPHWVDTMIEPMITDQQIVGVYGRYSFLPQNNETRLFYYFYEKIAGVLIRIRKSKREHINFLGLNMGFVTEIAKQTTGFQVDKVRKFDNALGSDYFVDEAEDGKMAVNLKTKGKLKLVTKNAARVITSSRRLNAEGGLVQSFINRAKLHLSRTKEYIRG